MKKLAIILLTISLTGCGHQPLAGKMAWFGDMMDAQDPCQQGRVLDYGGIEAKEVNGRTEVVVRPAQTTYPNFCGAGKGYVHVKGYTRSDGTYVSSHIRSSPDGNPYNNLSR